MAECLPRMNIADVDLDEWDVHTHQSISDSNAGMRESSWIDDNGVDISTCLVDAIDYHTLMVRLQVCKCYCLFGALLLSRLDDLRKRG